MQWLIDLIFDMLPKKSGGGATFLIASDEASDIEKARSDYVCDGVDDHVQIQAALVALPATGGSIILSAGTFNVDPIRIGDGDRSYNPGGGGPDVDNVLFAGQGFSTVLKLQPQNLTAETAFGVLELYGVSTSSATYLYRIIVRDLVIDGNKGNHSGAPTVNHDGIDLKMSHECLITHVFARNCEADGFDLDIGERCIISNCMAHNCGGAGFHLSNGTRRSSCIGNIASACGSAFSRPAFDLFTSTGPNLLVGNVASRDAGAVNNHKNFLIQSQAGDTYLHIVNSNLSTDSPAALDEFYKVKGEATLNASRKSYAASTTHTTPETIVGITNTAAPRTITIPTAYNVTGKILVFKDESGGAAGQNITIATQGAANIDGAATATISANYGTIRLYSDGTNWFTF